MQPSIVVGGVEIVPLLDAVLPNPIAEALPGIVPAELERAAPGLVGSDGMVQLPVTCYLVRSRGVSVLVDTGVGPRRRGSWPAGRLDARLAEIGVLPADIDVVVNTHFHADHVGWNTIDDADGRPRPWFPNARYLVQEAEWAHWADPGRLDAPSGAHLRECVAPLFDLADVRLVGPDESVTPEVSCVALPGHTPGHVGVGVVSGSERAIVLGDASHFLIQLDHPDWSPAWDHDPLQAAASRRGMIARAEADGSVLVGGHWPYPGLGRVVRVRGRRVFRAAVPRAAVPL